MKVSAFALITFLAGMASCASPPPVKPCGACIKMPSADGRGFQYHVRIPKGDQYHRDSDYVPGAIFQEYLEPCNIDEFYAVYDVEGNAHIDFVVRSRNGWLGRNKCDIDAHINAASHGKCKVLCKQGPPTLLADEWLNNNGNN